MARGSPAASRRARPAAAPRRCNRDYLINGTFLINGTSGGAARQLRNVLGCRLAPAKLRQARAKRFYTRWLIFCNLPAESLQPASRMFTTCHPFVFLQQHSLFLILPMLICFTSLAAHTMSLSRMANHGPAKQPRDRGLIVIVTIGQPSNPATAG